jgi:pyruvate carboxylase
VLIIKLINIGAPDKDGRRVINFELNGLPREGHRARQEHRQGSEVARQGRRQ